MKSSDSRFNKCLYFSSNALARKVEKLAAESWRQIDLTPSHAYVLLLVLEEPGVQPGKIAKELQLKPSTITRLMEKLEERKLVIRISGGAVTSVIPTPKATELHQKMKVCLYDFNKKCAAIISREETMQMVRQMNSFTDKFPL